MDQPFDCHAGPAMSLALRLFDEFKQFDASSPLIVEGLTLSCSVSVTGRRAARRLCRGGCGT